MTELSIERVLSLGLAEAELDRHDAAMLAQLEAEAAPELDAAIEELVGPRWLTARAYAARERRWSTDAACL